MKFQHWLVSLAACLVLLAGCSANTVERRIVKTATTGVTVVEAHGELAHSVYAAFKTGETGTYEIFVRAWFDVPNRLGTFVTAQGEIERPDGDLYYRATARDDAASREPTIDLAIDDSFGSATLTATLHIVSCTDEDDRPVADTRCPVGQAVDISAAWHSGRGMEYLSTPEGQHNGRGQQCAANGTLGGERYKSAEYALIVENRIAQ